MSANRGLFDDLESLTRDFGDGLDGHLGAVPQSRADPYAGASFGARPGGLLEGVLTGNRPDLFAGTGPSGADLFAGTAAGGGDPFAGVAWGNGGQQGNGGPGGLLGGLFSGIGTAAHNLFEGAFGPKAPPATTSIGTPGAGDTGGGVAGADFGSPSLDQVEGVLAGTPLAGHGAAIAQYAQQYGVPISVALAIFRQESSFGKAPAAGTTYNYGGLKGSGPAGFADFNTADEGLRAVIANMGTNPVYRGKTLRDFLLTYAPPGDGNDTEAYINNVLGFVNQLGGRASAGSVVVGNPTTATGGASAGGYTFPVAGYRGQVDLHWGASKNAADIMAPEGSAILALGNGTVVDASYNTLGGNTVTLRLDSGLLVYMAHLQGPASVQAGQRVQSGQQLGQVGTTGNAAGGPAHLHIGIGRDIQSGSGAEGGAGTPWGNGPNDNAWGLLNGILNGGH